MSDQKWPVDYGKRNAKCQKCKNQIEKGEVRIAKLIVDHPTFGDMKQYHHPTCLFESFKRVRPTTKVIEDPGDMDGWSNIKDEDKQLILKLIRAHSEFAANRKSPKTPKPTKNSTPKTSPPIQNSPPVNVHKPSKYTGDLKHKDNTFREFRRLVARIEEDGSSLAKTEKVKEFFSKGSDGSNFQGDLHLWVKLLIPGVVKRVYNLQNKQLVKIFSRIFKSNESKMLTNLDQSGDVAATIAEFFENSSNVEPAKKATLFIHEVDDFLESLTFLTREDEQMNALSSMAEKCTVNDLTIIIRLIKADLRMGAGAKPILDALHKDANEAFNSSRQIDFVISKIVDLRKSGNPYGPLDVGLTLMSPIQPMLAQACKSVDMAFDKCPNGMYSEIKYDGERVQVHKNQSEFKYFSRSLKPVQPHKIATFKEHIPKAFPNASELILDAEVLMVDNNTGDSLPFGTMGIHKAAGFKDATPCLFVFDLIWWNGQDLSNISLKNRKDMLRKEMIEVGNHIKFSEAKIIHKKAELAEHIQFVLKKGLEGLVLKDTKSIYEPGKRHWLKVKKDYLNQGSMADSADLVVLGASYGTGKRGGNLSVFLMGCYDEKNNIWKTVTKVHTGHDDKTLDRLQGELKPNMIQIKKNYDSVPPWLECTRQMTPEFVAKDPQASPVWEISGAEFTKAQIHTANGVSIRFPRVTKIRDDKTWKTATSLDELVVLFEESKKNTDIDLDYSSKEIENPFKLETPPRSPSTSFSSSSSTPSKIEDLSPTKMNSTPSPVKKVLVHDENVDVVIGSSGKSFDKMKIKSKTSNFELNVIFGDLFKLPDQTTSFAHCVSRDLKMGKGIAKLFRDKFGRTNELAQANAKIGEAAILKLSNPNRFIYNMVTKEKYSDFPTYDSLQESLIFTRDHALKNKVHHIAMPKIGCGLDKLNWNAVRTLIKNVFLDTDIKISVYHLDAAPAAASHSRPISETNLLKRKINDDADETDEKAKMPKKNGKYPMLDIAEGNLTPMTSNQLENKTTTKHTTNPKTEEMAPLKFPKLPDVFSGDKIFLQKGMKDKDGLERYIIAYGGEVVPEESFGDATIIVRAANQDASKSIINGFGVLSKNKAPQVDEKWLRTSIKCQTRKNLTDYQF